MLWHFHVHRYSPLLGLYLPKIGKDMYQNGDDMVLSSLFAMIYC